MRAQRPGETWEIGHIGGHRFAATFLAFPHGLCFGRVPAARGPEIAAALEARRARARALPRPGRRLAGRAGGRRARAARARPARARRPRRRGRGRRRGDAAHARRRRSVASPSCGARMPRARSRAAPSRRPCRRSSSRPDARDACSSSRAGRSRRPRCREPEPSPGRLLLRVHACGVCRTDLHLRDGELEPGHLPLILGHQIVGHRRGRPPRRRALARLDVRRVRVLRERAREPVPRAHGSPAATSTAATRSTRSPTSATASRCPTG